jgi:hypothetical protein
MVQPRKAKAKILDGLSRLAKSAHDQGDNPLFQQLSSATAKFESTGAIDDELLRRAYAIGHT